jgi:hypothetical protein
MVLRIYMSNNLLLGTGFNTNSLRIYMSNNLLLGSGFNTNNLNRPKPI